MEKLRTFEDIEKNIVEYKVMRNSYGTITTLFSGKNEEEAKKFYDEASNLGDVYLKKINELEVIYNNTIEQIKAREKHMSFDFGYNELLMDKSNIERYLENKELKKNNKIIENISKKDINIELATNFHNTDKLEAVFIDRQLIVREKREIVLQNEKTEYYAKQQLY